MHLKHLQPNTRLWSVISSCQIRLKTLSFDLCHLFVLRLSGSHRGCREAAASCFVSFNKAYLCGRRSNIPIKQAGRSGIQTPANCIMPHGSCYINACFLPASDADHMMKGSLISAAYLVDEHLRSSRAHEQHRPPQSVPVPVELLGAHGVEKVIKDSADVAIHPL